MIKKSLSTLLAILFFPPLLNSANRAIERAKMRRFVQLFTVYFINKLRMMHHNF